MVARRTPKPLFILAPMDDVTDSVFRQIVSSCSKPDLSFSEFVNVEGLVSVAKNRLLKKLEYSESAAPLVAHLWGLNPANFERIAAGLASGETAKSLGLKANYAGIDLNMGCPVRHVTKSGACSALIKNHALAEEIIQATQKGASKRLPVSVKTRLGFDKIDPAWTRFLLEQNLAMLSVHLRTVKEMSRVPAHFEELERLRNERDEIAPDTLLIANGDIRNKAHGLELIKRYGVDGVMIGRGVFDDPFVFSSDSPWPTMGPDGKIALLLKHLRLQLNYLDNPSRGVARLNKFARIYVSGFDGARELREKLANCQTIQQMMDVASAFQP